MQIPVLVVTPTQGPLRESALAFQQRRSPNMPSPETLSGASASSPSKISPSKMSKHWGRKVADLGLNDFRITLEQALKAGKPVVKYPRFSHSTGLCPLCRAKHQLMLWQRSFPCCSTAWDRDQATKLPQLRPGAVSGQEPV
jgi:hypothetical protein